MRISPSFALVLVLAATFGCSSRANPTVSPAVTTDPAVGSILAGSCYDCHSDEGAGQWYAKLQPSRWFGDPALDALNFSDWQTLDTERRKDTIRQIAAVVDDGTMPPHGYLLFHPQARPGPEQKAAIARWATAEGAIPAH
jgi:hypothetical protein